MTRTAFRVVVLGTLAFFGFFGVVVLQPDLFAALLGRETAGHIGHHFREYHHRVHDLTFAFLMGTALVGMLAQLRAPWKNAAGQLMALIPFIGLTLTVILTNAAVLSIPWVTIGASTLLATTLHPTALSSAFSPPRANRPMLALVIIAALPLFALAFANVGLQRTTADDHAALGHYGFIAAFSFTLIGVGLLASLRPDGWRLAARVAGSLAALLGLASVVFPDVASSLSLVWAGAAIAWGIVFLAITQLTRDDMPVDQSSVRVADGKTGVKSDYGSATSTPGWVKVFGVIVTLVMILFVALHLTGGAPGGHTP